MLFLNSHGRLLDPSNLRNRFAALAQRAGVDRCSPYTLRTSAAKTRAKEGKTLIGIAAMLGHSTVLTTAKHYLPTDGGEAMFDGWFGDEDDAADDDALAEVETT